MEWVIGADHRGLAHKEAIKPAVSGMAWHDIGAYDTERSDYPIFAHAVCQEIIAGRAQAGVLICGSGIGMAITANRYKGIYAGLVWNEEVARLSKEHDNTNVIVIPSDFVSADMAIAMVSAWSRAEFLEGEYRQRIQMIDAKLTDQ